MKGLFCYIALLVSLSSLANELKTSTQTIRGQLGSRFGELSYEIHYPEHDYYYAQLIHGIIQRDAPKMIEYFEFAPAQTLHFILDDKNKSSANGSATLFPASVISLNDFPPLGQEHLNKSHNWLRVLVVHELAHIMTLAPTKGFMGLLDRVFGSTAQLLKMLVPRWYSEGLAVWAESAFTVSGRLRQATYSKDLLLAALNPHFCKDVSCLSSPNHYPYAAHAYWVGSAFLKYLENQKKGTLRCLVWSHAGRMPFFLNALFKRCAGGETQSLLDKFVQHLRALAIEKKIGPYQTDKVKNWQAGDKLYNHYRVWVSSHDQENRIEVKNYLQKTSDSLWLNAHIDAVQPSTKGLPKSFNLAYVRTLGVEGSRIYPVRLHPPKLLSQLPFEADIYHALAPDSGLIWKYTNARWKLSYWQGTQFKSVLKLEKYKQIKRPRLQVVNEQLWLTVLQADQLDQESMTLVLYILSKTGELKAIKNIHDSSDWDFLESCAQPEGSLLVLNRGERELMTIRIDSRFQSMTKDWYQLKPQARPIYQMSSSDFGVTVDDATAEGKIYKNDCQGVVQSHYRLKVSRRSRLGISKPPVKQTLEQSAPVETYPSLRHFRPNYWFFSLAPGNNLTYYSIFTHLTDPKERHRIELSATYSPRIQKIAPVASYKYDPGPLYLQLGYSEFYGFSEAFDRIQENRLGRLVLGKEFEFFRSVWNPTLQVDMESKEDFLAKRNARRVSLWSRYAYTALQKRAFLRDLSFSIGAKYQETKHRESFFGADSLLKMSFETFSWLRVYVRAAYSQIDVKSLASDSLFGGSNLVGLSSSENIHEFFGLDYADLFGDEMLTGRTQLDFQLLKPYKGFGFFPLYIKTVNLLLGGDYARSDFLIYNNVLFRDEDLVSAHAGIRTIADIFYNAPVSIDLIAARVLKSPREKAFQAYLVINAELPI